MGLFLVGLSPWTGLPLKFFKAGDAVRGRRAAHCLMQRDFDYFLKNR